MALARHVPCAPLDRRGKMFFGDLSVKFYSVGEFFQKQ